MTYADFFSEIKGKFMEADISDLTEHLAYQFNITGEGEGIFYVEAKDGKLFVEPYEYYDRDAMFTCTADTTQKLKVEGSIEKALKLKEIIDSKKKKKK